MTSRPRVILVTGAATGVGAAVCRELAEPGTKILVHTRSNRDGALKTAGQVQAAGAEAEVTLADLIEPHAATAIVARTVERFGRLDVLVSNAGFADRTPLTDLSDEAMTRSTETIQGAFFRLARAAIPHLSTGGRIVAVSSFVAHAFRPDMTVFPASAAAKAGLEALVRALAIELGPRGITVNAVVPGFIRKDAGAHKALAPGMLDRQLTKIPLGRIGLPEDIAAAVRFLASPAAGYITGQALHVDGGLVI